ncbi:Uncharacterised protein [Chlamydia trachomatis]|nr:Uncharacterised protein [Chlamydia trachomatis]
MHAIGLLERLGIAIALDVNAKDASACLNLLIPMTGRQLDELGHLGTILVAFFLVHHVATLTQDVDALLHFFETHHVAVIAVTIFKHNLVKLNFVVE